MIKRVTWVLPVVVLLGLAFNGCGGGGSEGLSFETFDLQSGSGELTLSAKPKQKQRASTAIHHLKVMIHQVEPEKDYGPFETKGPSVKLSGLPVDTKMELSIEVYDDQNRLTGSGRTGEFVVKPGPNTVKVVVYVDPSPTDLLVEVEIVDPASQVILVLSPASAEVLTGDTYEFKAQVLGSDNQQVTWSVKEGPAGGAIVNGLYTAPNTPGEYSVVATSVANPSKKATATVTVTEEQVVKVTIDPPKEVPLTVGGTHQFTATVTGTTNTAVTWSVQEGTAGGTATQAGFYTAPNTAGTYHVVATSVADPSKSDKATVTVTEPTAVEVHIDPPSVTMAPGDTQPFTATVTGTTNTAVTWRVKEEGGRAGGTITQDGIYTAPLPRLGTDRVVATSVADPSKNAEAVVSVESDPVPGLLALGGADGYIRLVWKSTGETYPAKTMGHPYEVKSVAFSPDGRQLASGGRDGKIRLWWVETGTQIFPEGIRHGSAVYSVAFSPDGQTLASGGDASGSNPYVKLWSVEKGTQIAARAMKHDADVNTVAFSPDGQKLASGGGQGDGTIKLWRMSSGHEGEPIRSIPTSHIVYSVAFLPDSGEKLASGGNDHKVRLWWVETGQEIDDIDPPMLHAGYHVYSVAFSPDGQKLASGESEGYVKLWWVESGDEITIGPMAHLDGQYVRSVAFSPDGQILASGGHDNYVRLWSVSDGTEILTIGNASDVETVAFSPVQ